MASKKKKAENGRHSFSARRQERKRKKKVQAYLHGDVKIPPSAHGRLSVQIGLIGIVLFVAVFTIAYYSNGDAGAFIGALGLIGVILSCIGIYQGLIGFSENKKDFSPNKRGIILNLILLIVLILMFFSGLKR